MPTGLGQLQLVCITLFVAIKCIIATYVPGLDGLHLLEEATICGEALYQCVGCPSVPSNATATHTGRPFTDFNDQYVSRLVENAVKVSVVSHLRLRATAYLLKSAILSVPGDIVETGVFTGGSGILMAVAMKDFDICGRKYWGFDSFQGLPGIVEEDKLGSQVAGVQGWYSAGFEQVKATFASFGVDDPNLVRLVPGWFNESLPHAEVKHIAFLRLDGDLFVSTRDALVHLYHKVVPGGYIYVDDYGGFNGCRAAVDAFRMAHGIASPLHWIKEVAGTVEAVWWRKLPNRDADW